MINTESHPPDYFSRRDWQTLHQISIDAHHALVQGRSYDDIAEYTAEEDFERFLASHIDPTAEAGGRFNAGQDYENLNVAIAEKIVGLWHGVMDQITYRVQVKELGI
jgi:hypothetical protein